jgi:hypothetical protein
MPSDHSNLLWVQIIMNAADEDVSLSAAVTHTSYPSGGTVPSNQTPWMLSWLVMQVWSYFQQHPAMTQPHLPTVTSRETWLYMTLLGELWFFTILQMTMSMCKMGEIHLLSSPLLSLTCLSILTSSTNWMHWHRSSLFDGSNRMSNMNSTLPISKHWILP